MLQVQVDPVAPPRPLVRRLYTPALANRSLPLVRRIAADIQETARRIQAVSRELAADAAGDFVPSELEALRDRFDGLVAELEALGVELKDPLTGLLDFRARRGSSEVYLCWRLGEDAVLHWHELGAGFGGRQPIAEF